MVKPLVPPMVDILGPYVSTPQHVVSRPGFAGDAAGAGFSWLRDCTDDNAEDGTPLTAKHLNNYKAQLLTLAQEAGLTLTVDEDEMTFRAARQLGGESHVAGGTANALTVSPGVPFISFAQLSKSPLRIKATATNTGPSTLAVGAFAAKPLLRFDASPLAAKDVVEGDDLVIRADVALDAYRLQSPRASIGRGALVRVSGTPAYATGVESAIAFADKVKDTDGIWSAGAPTRLLVPATATEIQLFGHVTFENDTNGDRKIRVVRNGVDEGAFTLSDSRSAAGGADVTICHFSGPEMPGTPGDFYEIYQIQTSGSVLGVRAGAPSWFGMKIVR